MSTESQNIINTLAAGMGGNGNTEEYVSTRTEALEHADDFEKLAKKAKVKTMKDYDKWSNFKSMISSLYCFAFNNHLEIWERMGDIEGVIGKKLKSFVQKQTIKDIEARTISRYVLWNRVYYYQDSKKVFETLLKHDLLRKKGRGLYIVGLHYKVGDNTFTIDRMGRGHRNYIGWCGFQALSVNNSSLECYIEKKDKWNLIPVLDDRYETIGVYDGKYCVRPIRLRQEEKRLVRRKYCTNY